MKKKKTVRVGIIGAGFMGLVHAKAYARMESVELAAVSDQRLEKARDLLGESSAAVHADAETMMCRESLDMVDICLPTPFHRDMAIMAAGKGIHVLCEKPMALKVHEALDMIDAAKKSGVLLMIAHCLRFSREYNFLKECIENGKYGKLLSLNLFRHSSRPAWSENGWMSDLSKSGGVAMDLHIHDSDMLLYLLGSPQSVFSSGGALNISTLYGYPGMSVHAEASWRTQEKFPFRMGYDAAFEGASVAYENGKVSICKCALDPSAPEKDGSGLLPGLSDDFYFNELEYFVDCIRDGRKPLVCIPEDSLMSQILVLSEIESANDGRKIDSPSDLSFTM